MSKEKRRLPLGAIIGAICAVVVLVAFVVCLSLATAKAPESIGGIDELEEALANKTHVNCLVAHPEEGNFLIQANDGFVKAKVVIYDSDGFTESMLAIDNTMYYWDDDGYAFLMSDREAMDELIEEVRAGFDDEEMLAGYTIDCESPSKSDFAVPSLDFVDVSDL